MYNKQSANIWTVHYFQINIPIDVFTIRISQLAVDHFMIVSYFPFDSELRVVAPLAGISNDVIRAVGGDQRGDVISRDTGRAKLAALTKSQLKFGIMAHNANTWRACGAAAGATIGTC